MSSGGGRGNVEVTDDMWARLAIVGWSESRQRALLRVLKDKFEED